MKVFLSSTYLDLIEHRKAVVNALRSMDEEVGHMEIFGARDSEATSVSLEELDKCDVLVGVYAYRYGTVPAGAKASVTEQEYLHAMSKKIPVLVFVVDESHPWLPKSMDKSQAKIKKFKSKATKEHTPDYFTSPDNLASKVVSSIGRLAKKLDPRPTPISVSPISYSPPKPTGSTLPKQEHFFGRSDALTDRAYALAMQYGGGSKNYEKFPMLDAEWEFISAALPRLLIGDNARLQMVCTQLERFLDFTGRWDDLLWLSEQAEARALAIDDKTHAGWRAYQASNTYYHRKQPAEVLACAARATEYWQNSTPFNKATVIQLRGHGYQLQKDYPSAISAYRECLEIAKSIFPESQNVAAVQNWLAGAEKANKDYSASERDYREALRIAKKINYQEGMALYTGNLAQLALDRKQWVEAESLAREALALSEKVGRQELIANDFRRLAKALLNQNQHLDEALSSARQAVEIYTRLRSPNLQSAQEMLAEIEQAMQDNK